MKINCHERLRGLTSALEQQVETALQERRDLGLTVPGEFEISLGLYNNGSAAHISLEDNSLSVYALSTVLGDIPPEYNNLVNGVSEYFNKVRLIFEERYTADNFLEILDDPNGELERYEASLHPDYLEAKKRGINSNRHDYDSLKAWIIQNAEVAQEMVNELMPILNTRFAECLDDLNVLRHEIDHIDIMRSKLGRKNNELSREKNDLAEEYQRLAIERKPGTKTIIQLKEKNKEIYENYPDLLILSEVRAHFFNYIQKGEWDGVDYNQVAAEVRGTVIRRYVRGVIPIQSIGYLLNSPEYAIICDMEDSDTVNAIIRRVHFESEDPSASLYNYDPSKVNAEMESQILDVEFPALRRRLVQRTIEAVDAIACAYEQDRSRFAKADREAETFDQYVAICRGE